MKAHYEQIVTLTLTLNPDEIDWLRGIMQNPMFVDNPSDEGEVDAKMRKVFWNALNIID